MNRFSRLLRRCGWCGLFLGVSDPTPPGQTGETTGICAQCQHHYFAMKETRL
jgi:hypothetical protein